MVDGNKKKNIFGVFLITKLLQQRLERIWQPSFGSAKIQSKQLLITTRK